MQSHLFIPWELALKLKEKGFNEPCFGCYVDTIDGYVFQDYLAPRNRDALIICGYELGFRPTIETPLYQQVQDWLEIKGIFIELIIDGWWEGDIIEADKLSYRAFLHQDGLPSPKPAEDLGASNRYKISQVAIEDALERI